MRSRIWRLAGVGVLCASVTAQTLADEPQSRGSDRGQYGAQGQPGGQQGRGGGNEQQRSPGGGRQNAPQQQGNEIIRGDNSRQFEPGGQRQNDGQGQGRVTRDPNSPVRPAPPPPQLPANSLPIQGRPDAVRQTQEPQRGNYQNAPGRINNSQNWQAGGPGARPGDQRWPGRPGGHGNGWGPGPQFRPGHVIDRFPDRDYRVPYGGRDYFYSAGYWYRPQGLSYVVVQPPRGIRVSYLPEYSREVWVGGSLLFLAAGSYYAYQQSTQDYIVVDPPLQSQSQMQQPVSNGYDVEAYPANGQSPGQVSQDGYECYRYAVQQSGFDPQTATYQPDASVVQAYRQAQGNCLGSRGYQVNF